MPALRPSSRPSTNGQLLPLGSCFSSPKAKSRQDENRCPPYGPRRVSPSVHGSAAELHLAQRLDSMSSFRRGINQYQLDRGLVRATPRSRRYHFTNCHAPVLSYRLSATLKPSMTGYDGGYQHRIHRNSQFTSPSSSIISKMHRC